MNNKFYDYKEVKAAAAGGWAGVLTGLGVDAAALTGRHVPCPGCGGKDRFRYDDLDGSGSWLCSGGGDLQSGGGLDLIQHVRGCDWKEAVNLVGEYLGLSPREWKGGGGYTGKVGVNAGVVAAPQPARRKVNELYSEDALRELVAGVGDDVDEEWFIERSPIDPRGITPGEFLDAVFLPGERALIFTSFFSQGEFGWEVGRGGFALAKSEGTSAVRSELPVDGGKDGVWFLSNPVTLGWVPNPRKDGVKSRRIKECVTGWRYLVLESDDAPDDLWLKFLAMFPDSIRAIYSSGRRSWHALVFVNAQTWAGMDGLLKGCSTAKTAGGRLGAKAVWSRFGADPGALTPVRLTRLPGCTRGGKLQRLIYLNPHYYCHLRGAGKMAKRRIVDIVPFRKV